MERRTFVAGSVATLCATTAGLSAEAKPHAGEVYELRTYTIKPAKRPILDEYLSKALIPAVKRIGAGHLPAVR